MTSATRSVPIHLLKGKDEIELRDATVRLLDELVDDGDHSLVVEEFTATEFRTDDVTAARQEHPGNP